MLFGVISMALIMAPMAAPKALTGVPASIALPVGVDDCDTACEGQCTIGGQHYAVGVEPEDAEYYRNEGWHNWPDCRNGSCSGTHGGDPCAVAPLPAFTAVDLEALVGSVRSNDMRGIRTVLDDRAGQVTLNRDREAIQVKACTGELWAHLPVAQEVVDALEEPSN